MHQISFSFLQEVPSRFHHSQKGKKGELVLQTCLTSTTQAQIAVSSEISSYSLHCKCFNCSSYRCLHRMQNSFTTFCLYVKPSRNKKGRNFFQWHQKWRLFLQLAAKKKTTFSALLICDSFSCLQMLFSVKKPLILSDMNMLCIGLLFCDKQLKNLQIQRVLA